MPPGLSHALIALVIQGGVAVVVLALYHAGLWTGVPLPEMQIDLLGLVMGAQAGTWFYVGRERRQAETGSGSNRAGVGASFTLCLREFCVITRARP